MKHIVIPKQELWDEENYKFVNLKEQKIAIEHSLISVSKWESKWHKPFFSKEEKTAEMTLDYIRFMTITSNVDPEVYKYLSNENLKEIREYMEDSYSATTFKDTNKHYRNEIITSELIYYDMIYWGIPFECEKWHINRLLTLIKICSIKGQKQTGMSQKDIMSQNAAINAARRMKHNTRG